MLISTDFLSKNIQIPWYIKGKTWNCEQIVTLNTNTKEIIIIFGAESTKKLLLKMQILSKSLL